MTKLTPLGSACTASVRVLSFHGIWLGHWFNLHAGGLRSLCLSSSYRLIWSIFDHCACSLYSSLPDRFGFDHWPVLGGKDSCSFVSSIRLFNLALHLCCCIGSWLRYWTGFRCCGVNLSNCWFPVQRIGCHRSSWLGLRQWLSRSVLRQSRSRCCFTWENRLHILGKRRYRLCRLLRRWGSFKRRLIDWLGSLVRGGTCFNWCCLGFDRLNCRFNFGGSTSTKLLSGSHLSLIHCRSCCRFRGWCRGLRGGWLLSTRIRLSNRRLRHYFLELSSWDRGWDDIYWLGNRCRLDRTLSWLSLSFGRLRHLSLWNRRGYGVCRVLHLWLVSMFDCKFYFIFKKDCQNLK